MDIVNAVMPPVSNARLYKRIQLAVKECNKYGLTSVHDAGLDLQEIQVVQQAIDNNEYPLRTYVMVYHPIPSTNTTNSSYIVDGVYNDSIIDYWCKHGHLYYGDNLVVRSVKMFLDGALGSRGAALLEPYSDGIHAIF